MLVPQILFVITIAIISKIFGIDTNANKTVVNMKYYRDLFTTDNFFHQLYSHHQDIIELIDFDGTKYIINKIKKENALESCYSVINHITSYEFCYPSIIVAGDYYNIIRCIYILFELYMCNILKGYPKCGTSSMHEFLISADSIQPAARIVTHDRIQIIKELCIFSIVSRNLNDFFRKLSENVLSHDYYHVNGCLEIFTNFILQYILEPKTVYILMVRELSTLIWGSYNFWCDSWFERKCKGGYHTIGIFKIIII